MTGTVTKSSPRSDHGLVQADDEAGPPAGHTVHRDEAVFPFQDGPGHGEADAGAVLRRVFAFIKAGEDVGEVLPGDSLTVVLDPDFAVEGILEPGQAEMPAHGRVLHEVFQDIEQGLRRPVRIAAAAGGGIPVIKQGLGFQLDRDEKRGRGLFEQGADRYRFPLRRK